MLQMKSKFYKVLLVVYSILSIGSTIYLLIQPEPTETKERYRKTERELHQIKEYLKSKDSRYKQTIDSLNEIGDSLQVVVTKTSQRLSNSRSQVNLLFNQLFNYTNSFNDTLRQKNEIAFDSLSVMSKEYVFASRFRDSLCDSENSTLKEIIRVKDSIIISADSLLNDYKLSNNQLLITGIDLNKALLKADKKIKRKTRFNRSLISASIFFSGLLISKYFIKQ